MFQATLAKVLAVSEEEKKLDGDIQRSGTAGRCRGLQEPAKLSLPWILLELLLCTDPRLRNQHSLPLLLKPSVPGGTAAASTCFRPPNLTSGSHQQTLTETSGKGDGKCGILPSSTLQYTREWLLGNKLCLAYFPMENGKIIKGLSFEVNFTSYIFQH